MIKKEPGKGYFILNRCLKTTISYYKYLRRRGNESPAWMFRGRAAPERSGAVEELFQWQGAWGLCDFGACRFLGSLVLEARE